jgi:hypothetical protein
VEDNLVEIFPGSSSEDELRRLVKLVDTSTEALNDARIRANRDRDYYDGAQWTDEELEVMKERGQPASVFNHIAPKINYILGTEIATRVDPETKPRTKSHEAESEASTDMLRYYADHIDFSSVRSDTFENMLIEGMGGFIFSPIVRRGQDGKPEVDIACKHVEWDRIIFDHMSKRRDFSDARWVGLVLWMDLDEALDMPEYAGKKEDLEAAVSSSTTPTSTEETFEDNPQTWSMRDPARVRIVQLFYKRGKKWVEAHFCGSVFLIAPRWVTLRDEDGNSWCPLMLAASFRTRRKSDAPSEPYGAVRTMISPQEMINKGRSKAQHLMQMRQIWAEDGAIQLPPQEALEQVAKPDGYIPLAPKALSEGRVKVESNIELAAAQVQMLSEAKSEIDTTGPSMPAISVDQRVRSGRAEQQRAEAGSKELAPMFESMRKLQRRAYKALWWMVKQFCPEERWLAVTDDAERVGYRFVALNHRTTRKARLQELLKKQVPLTEAIHSVGLPPVVADELLGQATAAAQQQVQQQAMAMQQAGQQVPPEALQSMMNQFIMQALAGASILNVEFVQNDVSKFDMDIILTEAPETAVVQQEEFDKITELVGTGMVKFPPEVIVEMSQLRNKKTLREMVKAPPPDPIQQEIQKIQVALMRADVVKKQAEVQDTLAHAQQRMADAQFKAGPMAEKTHAQALDHAAAAGNKVLPPPQQMQLPQMGAPPQAQQLGIGVGPQDPMTGA